MVYIPFRKDILFYLSKFIDIDKQQEIIYNNYYIKDYDYVVKIPFPIREKINGDIKFEKFNLAKYTYILDYE
ncbi:MAG: hypothetical protein JXA99_05265 [Candidatus Lokiarchaeota archaeon]|nr:hypothetical protein [Candidatus Lokiarchaeota archaeon]